MANYVVVRDEDNVIVNMVAWDGETQWLPPDGTTAVEDVNGEGMIGGTYVDGSFAPPE